LSIIGEIHDLKIAELVLDKIYMDANYVPNAFNLQTKHLSNALGFGLSDKWNYQPR
jgi:hypothetical protein